MKRLTVLSLAIALPLGSVTVASGQCALPGFSHLPPNTSLAFGPIMRYFAVNYPLEVGGALVAARDVWNTTDAGGRIGGWNEIETASDCPMNQPLQIGAFDFYSQPYCPTVTAYGVQNPADVVIAFVDYFPFQCTGCGTKSMSLNTAYAWAVNPGPGQYDLQSVLAHEFGHMLGFSHIRGFYCTNDQGLSCVQDPDRNTMQSNTAPGVGETCGRDLTGWDMANANYLY